MVAFHDHNPCSNHSNPAHNSQSPPQACDLERGTMQDVLACADNLQMMNQQEVSEPVDVNQETHAQDSHRGTPNPREDSLGYLQPMNVENIPHHMHVHAGIDSQDHNTSSAPTNKCHLSPQQESVGHIHVCHQYQNQGAYGNEPKHETKKDQEVAADPDNGYCYISV